MQAWRADDGDGTQSLSNHHQRLFPRGLNTHMPLAGLPHVSRAWDGWDRMVGPTQENFAAGFASEIPGNFPAWCFSAVLGICQCLKHRTDINKEIK